MPLPEMKRGRDSFGLGNAVDCSSMFQDNTSKSADIGFAEIKHSAASIGIGIGLSPGEAECGSSNPVVAEIAVMYEIADCQKIWQRSCRTDIFE
jgi:hypothetical protein